MQNNNTNEVNESEKTSNTNSSKLCMGLIITMALSSLGLLLGFLIKTGISRIITAVIAEVIFSVISLVIGIFIYPEKDEKNTYILGWAIAFTATLFFCIFAIILDVYCFSQIISIIK